MIAAFLPLPSNPLFVMRERSGSAFDVENEMARQYGPIDESRYESARWWRNLNRIMSVVGLAIVGAIVSLPPVRHCNCSTNANEP